jgi:hypothetical protein
MSYTRKKMRLGYLVEAAQSTLRGHSVVAAVCILSENSPAERIHQSDRRGSGRMCWCSQVPSWTGIATWVPRRLSHCSSASMSCMIRVIYAEAGSMLHDYPIRPESRLVLVCKDVTLSQLSISRWKASASAIRFRRYRCLSTVNADAAE